MLKTSAILHDPPHKSFLITSPREDFRFKHEQVAKSFRDTILNGTSLAPVHPHADRYTRIYDALASTIERKMIKYIEWPKGFYLPYNRLHNIFDPSLVVAELMPPQNLEQEVMAVAKEINDILQAIDGALALKSESERLVTLYNALFLLLEASWYSHGLPPALADTRIPTHTVFDHTYATAAIANIVSDVGEGYEPVIKGLYLFIDFPGVQKFVGSGRKAGDFWASSWIASRVMWGIAEEFAFRYGFDVILSPSPRLNPYAANALFKRLGRLEKDLAGRPGVKLLNALKSYSIYPLVPATISLLIPQIDSDTSTPSNLVRFVKDRYLDSWKNIVKEVIDDLAKTCSNAVCRLLLEKLNELRDLIDAPPQGVRIYVVDVGKLYEYVLRCLHGDSEACRATGIGLGDGEFKKLEEVMTRIACRSQQKCDSVEELRRDLAFTITWHLLHTKAIDLAKRFGEVAVPSPRPFWVLEEDSLKPVASFVGNWIPCTLCGVEPAVIKFAKKPTEEGEVTFDFQRSEGIPKTVSVAELERRENLEELEKLFKPGEALGPYCLLKRAVYLAHKSELKIASTEDVAFAWKVDKLYRYVKVEEIAEKLIGTGKVVPDVVNAVRSLLGVGAEKDIDVTAKVVGARTGQRISSEALVQKLSKILIDVCSHGLANPNTVFNVVKSLLPNGYKAETAGNVLDAVKGFGDKGYRVGEFCKVLEIPTTFAIVRADADYIGDLHKGVKPLKLDEYMERLATVLLNALRNYLPEGEASKISRGVAEVAELFKALKIDGVPVTPARTSALSLTLVLQAVKDSDIIRGNNGLLVFSGGDDILALLPPETAIKASFELRKSYEEDVVEIPIGDGINVKVYRMHIPLGRSFSVRFTNIRDLMNVEMGKAYDLLEDVAKGVKWRSPSAEWEKDAVVVSDSRSGRVAILPLRRDVAELSVDGYGLALLVALGTLSSGIPEDFESWIGEAKDISSNALAKIFAYVLRRNVISVEDGGRKLVDEVMKELGKWVEKAGRIDAVLRDKSSNLLKEVSTLLAILRRYL
jgi:CRISPR-associated protein Cmr2